MKCTHVVTKWGRERLTAKRVQEMLTGNSRTYDSAFPKNKKAVYNLKGRMSKLLLDHYRWRSFGKRKLFGNKSAAGSLEIMGLKSS